MKYKRVLVLIKKKYKRVLVKEIVYCVLLGFLNMFGGGHGWVCDFGTMFSMWRFEIYIS